MTPEEGPEELTAAPSDEMFRAFWESRSREYRKKWNARIKSGLSDKRKFQINRQMAEFFARQKGPMEAVAKAKRSEFQQRLDACERDIRHFEQCLGNARMSREQLKGAIEGIDLIFKAAGASAPTSPAALTFVPPPQEEPKLIMNPEPPAEPSAPAPGPESA